MTTNRRHAALFDLDGVLIDSEGVYSTFWSGIDRLYPTGIENFAAAIKGTTLTEILTHFETDEIREDVKRRIHDFEATMTYRLMPGVLTFFDDLKSCGWPIAIYTSSDDVKMAHLRGQQQTLLDDVDVIITGSHVSRSKPDPEGYLLAAERLGVDISDCVVFEDSLQGLEAGRQSGAIVVALATTNSASVLEGRGDIVINDLSELTVDRLLEIFS